VSRCENDPLTLLQRQLMRRRLDASSMTVSAVLTPVRLGIRIISSGSIDGRSMGEIVNRPRVNTTESRLVACLNRPLQQNRHV
jgi:hypothetical protein